jgi:hypothetical protein
MLANNTRSLPACAVLTSHAAHAPPPHRLGLHRRPASPPAELPNLHILAQTGVYPSVRSTSPLTPPPQWARGQRVRSAPSVTPAFMPPPVRRPFMAATTACNPGTNWHPLACHCLQNRRKLAPLRLLADAECWHKLAPPRLLPPTSADGWCKLVYAHSPASAPRPSQPITRHRVAIAPPLPPRLARSGAACCRCAGMVRACLRQRGRASARPYGWAMRPPFARPSLHITSAHQHAAAPIHVPSRPWGYRACISGWHRRGVPVHARPPHDKPTYPRQAVPLHSVGACRCTPSGHGVTFPPRTTAPHRPTSHSYPTRHAIPPLPAGRGGQGVRTPDSEGR